MFKIVTLKKILIVSRPRFWLYLGGTFLLGYSFGANTLSDFLNFRFFWLLTYFLLFANFYVYGLNDFFDTDTDAFNPKKGTKEFKLTKSETDLLKAIILVSIVATLITGLFFISRDTIILFTLFVLLATFYSAPPIRLKAQPYLDSASNFFYVIPGLIGYVLSSGSYPGILVYAAGFFWTFAMHLFSAVPDIEADKKASVKTTASLLGFKNSLFLCFVMWLVFSIIVTTTGFFGFLGFVFFIYPVVTAAVIFFPSKVGNFDIEKIYWAMPYLNGVMGFFAFIYSTGIIKV